MPHNYNSRNAHQRDTLLHFDEEKHIYTLNGKPMISVTTLVDEYFEKFDADYWAARKAPKLGITPEQLKARWEENAQRARDLARLCTTKSKNTIWVSKVKAMIPSTSFYNSLLTTLYILIAPNGVFSMKNMA